MKYYKATLSNGKRILFSASNPDAAINYGNKQGDKTKTTMVAIAEIPKKDAIAAGLCK